MEPSPPRRHRRPDLAEDRAAPPSSLAGGAMGMLGGILREAGLLRAASLPRSSAGARRVYPLGNRPRAARIR